MMLAVARSDYREASLEAAAPGPSALPRGAVRLAVERIALTYI